MNGSVLPEELRRAALPGERWAECGQYPGRYVSDRGRFFSSTAGVTQGAKHGAGYRTATIRYEDGSKTVCLLHRLVAEAFVPGRSKSRPHINHRNGVKHDNRVENLEWCSIKENNQHAWRTGLAHGVPGNPGATDLTLDQVEAALLRFVEHHSVVEVAVELNIDVWTARLAVRGKTWAHARRQYDQSFVDAAAWSNKPRGDAHKNTRLSEEDLVEVRAALSRGETGASIAARFEVSRALVSKIKNGKARVAA